jgi:hypothetical protein
VPQRWSTVSIESCAGAFNGTLSCCRPVSIPRLTFSAC